MPFTKINKPKTLDPFPKKKKQTSCHLHKRNYIVTHPTATPTNNGPSIFLEKKKKPSHFLSLSRKPETSNN
jgi:hypothetical protein